MAKNKLVDVSKLKRSLKRERANQASKALDAWNDNILDAYHQGATAALTTALQLVDEAVKARG
jgi:hypothetical protein